MEARYRSNKVVSTSYTQKHKGEIVVKRKSLVHNLRPASEKKRDLPPLTPLHRLQRFKAIRDKNLKTKLRKTFTQNILLKKMDQAENKPTTINEKDEAQENTVCVLKPVSTPDVDNKEHSDNHLTIGQNGHVTSGENLANGHENSKVDNGIGEEANEAKDSLTNGNDILSEPTERAEEIEVEEEPCKIDTGHNKEKASSEKNEAEDDNDRESSASSSTFASNKEFLHSSTEDMSEALQDKAENSEEEEIDVDRVSSTEEETGSLVSKVGEEVIQEAEKMIARRELITENKKQDLPPRIPRSVSSASSYKTAYGSLTRISGRRPVTARGRKRPAEPESPGGEPRASPSLPSPRWRFFHSSVSKLWSPSNLSPCATPLRNIDDSMTVNVNEDTINCHLNDPDLFSEMKGNPPPHKRSRWGCTVM